jgi:hypothetical protein|tara:strand:- start:348 stop:1115 length:768 start_codon:yes stop_codon:yes gene_type:complete
MATTYLELTNEVLRELNEIPLTSANFTSAVGLQQFVKDSINKSIFDIANEEPQLPFLAVGESGGTDPFYGNVTVASVAGTRWYELKASSSSLKDDYASIDWDDFYLTTINVSGETAPFVSKGLGFLSLADWKRYYRDSENVDDADAQSYGEPSRVIKSPDGRKFGLSPIPDKVYNIHFYAFDKPTKLSAHGDTVVFPEQYTNVITARARYYVWQFKESPQQAAFAMDDYKKAMRTMKSNLINPTPRAMTDDRRYF